MKKVIIIIAILIISSMSWADGYISNVPAIDQDIFEVTFNKTGICGPTTFAEIAGYWGNHGYPNLLRGQLSGIRPDTSAGMQALFVEAMDYSGYTYLTYPTTFAPGMEDYFQDNGYDVSVVHRPKGAATWLEITKEIDAGRPVALLVWSWNHWIVVTGYTNNPQTMTVLYGHVPLERKLLTTQLPYRSQCEAVFIRPVTQPEPSADPSTQDWYEDVMAWCFKNG